MADFFQNGTITSLQNISHRPVEDIERELRLFSSSRKIALIMPALYSEFEGPALPVIIEELKKADYISTIVLSLDKANHEQFIHAKSVMSQIPCDVRVVWHDGPRMNALYRELKLAGFNVDTPGKGRSVWMTLGYVLSNENIFVIGFHDTDILNYSRELVVRLFYPIVHPGLDYEFSKGYYARLTDRLYGRVTRLFYTPLIRATRRIVKTNPFLEFLDSFRYALSGEFAFIATLARGIRMSPTWGLEVSVLSEVYTKCSVNRVAQVDLMETYEHKHQSIDIAVPDSGLIRMATEIARTLFRVLSQDGIIMSGSFFRTLQTTYIQETRFAIEKFNAVALYNGVPYDRHEEIANTELFLVALKRAFVEFMEDPMGVPMLPAWVRVRAALPAFQKKFMETVDEDNRSADGS